MGEPRRRRGQSSVPTLGQLRPWGVWPAAEEARLLAHRGGGGASRAAGRGTRGRCPWTDRRGQGQGGGTLGVRWLRPPLRLFWKRGFPSCFIGGEGPSPALSPPPPCERRSSNSGAQVAPRPWGIILSVSHEEREIPPPRAPGQHTPPPAEGADAHSLTPWSHTGTGTLQPKSRSSGVKGRCPSASCPQAAEMGRGSGSIRGDESRAFYPSQGALCAFTITPNRFVSPKAIFSRCCRGVTDALDRKWGNREKRPPPSPPPSCRPGGHGVGGPCWVLPLPLVHLLCWLRTNQGVQWKWSLPPTT